MGNAAGRLATCNLQIKERKGRTEKIKKVV
jgi:hypothetical protein